MCFEYYLIHKGFSGSYTDIQQLKYGTHTSLYYLYAQNEQKYAHFGAVADIYMAEK